MNEIYYNVDVEFSDSPYKIKVVDAFKKIGPNRYEYLFSCRAPHSFTTKEMVEEGLFDRNMPFQNISVTQIPEYLAPL